MKTYYFIASLNGVSVQGSVNYEPDSSTYSVFEDKHIYADSFRNHSSVTIFPFYSLDAVVDYYLGLGFAFKFI